MTIAARHKYGRRVVQTIVQERVNCGRATNGKSHYLTVVKDNYEGRVWHVGSTCQDTDEVKAFKRLSGHATCWHMRGAVVRILKNEHVADKLLEALPREFRGLRGYNHNHNHESVTPLPQPPLWGSLVCKLFTRHGITITVSQDDRELLISNRDGIHLAARKDLSSGGRWKLMMVGGNTIANATVIESGEDYREKHCTVCGDTIATGHVDRHRKSARHALRAREALQNAIAELERARRNGLAVLS